jgi:hypothetical protein
MRRILGAAVGLLVLMSAGGCGDGRKDDRPPPITSLSKEQPEQVRDHNPD